MADYIARMREVMGTRPALPKKTYWGLLPRRALLERRGVVKVWYGRPRAAGCPHSLGSWKNHL